MIKCDFQTIPYDDDMNVKSEFMQILYKLILSIYCKTIYDNNISHPIVANVLERARQDAIIYTESNKSISSSEIDVINSLLKLYKSPIPEPGLYVPIKTITELVSNFPGNIKDQYLPVDFYVPFLSTAMGLSYVGPARICHLYITNSTIYATYGEVSQFDNSDLLFANSRIYKCSAFYKFLLGFSEFYNCTFDHLVTRLSTMALPNVNINDCNFNQFLQRAIAGIGIEHNVTINDTTSIGNFIRKLSQNSRTLDLENSFFFPHFAKYIGISDSVVSHILRPGTRTVLSKNAFQHSILSEYKLAESYFTGMEALEDDELEDGEELEDEEVETEDDDTETEDDPIEEETEEESEEEETEEEDKEDVFKLTFKLSLEPVAEDESVEDILYKEAMYTYIKSFNANPPDELSAEELLLLQIWINQWLFLVSADTTRQLLEHFNLTVIDYDED